MIIHTSLLWFSGGLTLNQSLIIIHPRYRGDTSLLAHEREHQAQMKRIGTLVFWWRYLTDKGFRGAAEVEAYCVSVRNGANIATCARRLSTEYMLGISVDEALARLTAALTPD